MEALVIWGIGSGVIVVTAALTWAGYKQGYSQGFRDGRIAGYKACAERRSALAAQKSDAAKAPAEP